MMFDLFKAVFASDIEAARAQLELMRACGLHSTAIMRARVAVLPRLIDNELSKPIILPQPGADPNTLFGGPKERQRFGAVKIKRAHKPVKAA